MTTALGWIAALILLITLGRQVYAQSQSGSTAGVSRWLFVGQITASVGFVTYSWLRGDWVFVATNAAILVTAVVGQVNYLRHAGTSDAESAARCSEIAKTTDAGRTV